MHVPIPCFNCLNEGEPPESALEWMPYTDDAQYERVCIRGHRTVSTLQQQRFEILFEIGAHALLDGYPREAVASFASSLERFYEFFVKSAWFQAGMDGDAVEAAWKPLGKQSERQLGAFVGVYTRDLTRPPKLLANRYVELRNRVIHEGKIPSHENAVSFGQGVLEVVRPAIQHAKEIYHDGSSKKVWHHLVTSRRAEDAAHFVATGWHQTILTLTPDETLPGEPTLAEELVKLASRRQNKSVHPTTRGFANADGG